MRYEHTQKGPIHWILFAVAAGFLATGVFVPERDITIVMGIGATILILAGLCFARLTIRDEGEALAIRYGPLPVFHRRLQYCKMGSVERARSDVLDGGGIHYIPGRGWIYNLWGFDCVRIRFDGAYVRVGSDDVDGLLDFLERRIGGGPALAG